MGGFFNKNGNRPYRRNDLFRHDEFPGSSLRRDKMKRADFRFDRRPIIVAFAVTSTIVLSLFVIAPTCIRAADKNTPENPKSYQLEFSGDGHVEISNFEYDGSHPITLEARVIPSSAGKDAGGRQCVVGNLELSGLGLHYSGDHWMFHYNEGREGSGYASAVSDDAATLKKPVHIAGVFDGKNVTLFVNGKKQTIGDVTTMKHKISYLPFMVGADPNRAAEPHQFFKGSIDEVRISKVARYTKDFQPAKKFESDKDTLVLYHFDEGTGDVVKDSSGNARDGKMTGAKWVESHD